MPIKELIRRRCRRDSYEVDLSNGAEIDFRQNGEWKSIKCYSGVPASEVPSAIAAAVAKQYPNVVMVEIEKEYQGYEIKLQNRMELYFNLQGQLLYQKYDD